MSERLAKMARIAGLREDRALRAWRAATEERDACASTQAQADAVQRSATLRAGDARSRAMADPCSDQAWVWSAATRSRQTEAQATRAEADEALETAALAAARSRVEHARSQARAGTIDDRLTRARNADRRRAEGIDAEDSTDTRRTEAPR